MGLAIAATGMAGASTWQAQDTSRRSQETARELALSQAYQDINAAANREYSAQLRYLGTDQNSPTAAEVRETQRAEFVRAQADLHAAVDRVKVLGTVEDKALTTYVLMEDRQYAQNARTVFAAVEAGQVARAQQLAGLTGPRVDALISRVSEAAATHDRHGQQSMARLTARSQLAAVAIPTSFGVALLLLAACWVLLLQLNKAVRVQATALLSEKQLLSTVIESSPHFVYWKDAQGQFLGANRAFEDLHGPPELPAAAALPADAALPAVADVAPADADAPRNTGNEALLERLAEIENQVQAAGVAALDQQGTAWAPDGTERRLLFSVLPHPGPAGPGGVIGVGVDVTRLTDLERQLATANRLESVGRLAAGL
ncbi:MAG: hypothetical protein P8Z68_09715, partial [Kineosporiaceae bacterium]